MKEKIIQISAVPASEALGHVEDNGDRYKWASPPMVFGLTNLGNVYVYVITKNDDEIKWKILPNFIPKNEKL